MAHTTVKLINIQSFRTVEHFTAPDGATARGQTAPKFRRLIS